jgi:penicillin G amidase
VGNAPETQREQRAIPSPRRRAVRWAAYAALALVVLLLVGAAGSYGFARRSLPQVSGQLQLAGLTAPVSVYRDEWGVPHIEAQNSHDLFMAQGFVTAQDRFWEMDMSRRVASGRLSEVMGSATVSTDKFFRALMLREGAERTVNAVTPEGMAAMLAYADGVNAYIGQAVASARLPVEFTLLGYKPEPWTPVDSASVAKYMAYYLGDNFRGEVFRYQLRQTVRDDLFRELLPTYPVDGITIMKYTADAGTAPQTRLVELPPDDSRIDVSGLAAAAVWPDPFVGSNNWVVSGKLTSTGKPLLANDPHLGHQTPAIWHQIHLVIPGEQEHMNAIGVIFPGAPGVVVGHNEKVAWGVTNTGPDVQDLYIEKRNPANPYQFEFKGKWEDAKVLKQTIKVKGEPEIPYEVVVTRHGPIVSEVVGSEKNRPAEVLALRWTAHNPTSEFDAILGFDRASNWTEFRKALQNFEAPTQNFVFAAVDGTIAYHAAGIVPIRAKGDGLVPVPGWTGEYEWTGYIPFDRMPEVVNPPAGFIVSANNKAVDDAYPYLISHSWAEPYRATRIAEVLQSKTGLTADEMRLLQTDYLNLRARSFLPKLLPALDKATLSETEKGALALLRQWDYVDAADKGAPLVFQFWWRYVNKRLYEPTMGQDLFTRMDTTNVTDKLITDALAGRPGAWVKNTGGLESLLAQSFQDAVADVVTLQGKNPTAWTWGEYHRLGPQHPVGGAVKALGLIFNPKANPVGGSGITVGAMSYSASTGLVTSGAVWRQVVDLNDIAGSSRDVVTPGQSGHFLSRWYTSQQKMHLEGELHPQSLTPDAYQKGFKLLLQP